LRGRCARQGDPGSSRFYVSLEDDLMRLFGSDRIANVMSRLGLEEGQPLEARMLNRSIETAQKRVEQQNFSIRKRTLEYDNVMNKQREVIYGFRGDVVRNTDVREQIYDILNDVITSKAEESLDEKEPESLKSFVSWVRSTFPVPVRLEDLQGKMANPDSVAEDVYNRVKSAYDLKMGLETGGETSAKAMERHIILQSIDTHWQDYLRAMDDLRQGVGLRAYGQRDPLIEYKREAYNMFEELMARIKDDISSAVFRTATSVETFESFMRSLPRTMLVHDEVSILGHGGPPARPSRGMDPAAGSAGPGDIPVHVGPGAGSDPVRRESPKVNRNDPCPCGSGKKYKKCCGK
jgi:preprotein translocase subunit SecA